MKFNRQGDNYIEIFRYRMILKTAVKRFKIPFPLSLSKPALSEVVGGERSFESHPMGERRKAAHASTSLSTNGFSEFQLPFLG